MEYILNSLLHRKKLQYLVKWVGFNDNRTWYPASDFKGSPNRLRDFHKDYPDWPGPPKRLNGWIRAWVNDEDDVDRPDDERAQAWGQVWSNWGAYVMVLAILTDDNPCSTCIAINSMYATSAVCQPSNTSTQITIASPIQPFVYSSWPNDLAFFLSPFLSMFNVLNFLPPSPR